MKKLSLCKTSEKIKSLIFNLRASATQGQRPYIKTLLVILGAVFLCGCSTLSYSGNDFDKDNVKSVTTNESFYFSTYSKNLNDAVKISTGISKSNVSEILVSYFEIDNKSNENFTLNSSEVKVFAGSKPAGLITGENYISNYQGEQQEIYASTQSISPTISNMVSIANNYQGVETNRIAMEQNSSKASLRQFDELATGIREHSLNAISVVKPNEKKYYYIFIKDEETYPIIIEYKGLQYIFNERKK